MKHIHWFIYALILFVGTMMFLKVDESTNTLKQDKAFRESMRIMDKAVPQRQYTAKGELR